MPPEDDDIKKVKGWRRYTVWIVFGVVVVLILVAVIVKQNQTTASEVTLDQVSTQVGQAQNKLTDLALLIAQIPKTDWTSTLGTMQGSINQALAKIDSYSLALGVVNQTVQNCSGLLGALNQTMMALNQTIGALNKTVWENHNMLLDICVALNISLNSTGP
jgi:hypothetical protein